MIITKLQGGLGNQMFQYAFGRYLSYKLNTSFKLDNSYYENDKKREYWLDHFNISAQVATVDEIKKLKPSGFFHKIANKFFGRKKEQKMFLESHLFKKEVLDTSDNTYLEGFWQNEQYFKEIGDVLRREFVLKQAQPTEALSLLESITQSNSVSIHMRRGDYVLPKYREIFYPIGMEYYKKAISIIAQKVSEPHFFVFSDDISYAKTLPFPKNTTFIDSSLELKIVEEFALMTKCKHNIISNSTFSWWAAWLNANMDKVVIAPEKWSVYETDKKCGFIPKSWVRI